LLLLRKDRSRNPGNAGENGKLKLRTHPTLPLEQRNVLLVCHNLSTHLAAIVRWMEVFGNNR